MSKKDIILKAYSDALKLRKKLNISLYDTVSPIDISLRLGIDVRFEKLPMEGLYLNAENPQILLNTERPSGRISFSCAHELGHHNYSHGTKADIFFSNETSIYNSNAPEEFQADCFAGALLMPESLVLMLLSHRKVSTNTATAEDLYIVSGTLGVGYGTLVNHLAFMLKKIDHKRKELLLKQQPKKIRHSIINLQTNNELIVVDRNWKGRPIDLRKGDWLLSPSDFVIHGNEVLKFYKEINGNSLYRAIKRGIGNINDTKTDWGAFVRVSLNPFVGLAEHRHFEDEEEEVLYIEEDV